MDCPCTPAAHRHRLLVERGLAGAAADPCAPIGSDGIAGFALLGWFMFLFVFCLAVLSRRSELRLLQIVGLKDTSEYADYIAAAERKLQAHEEKLLAEVRNEGRTPPVFCRRAKRSVLECVYWSE